VNCRGCNSNNLRVFLDLGLSPIANNLIYPNELEKLEESYPLTLMTCLNCAFVQSNEVVPREQIFKSDYSYFSSYSTSWLKHCEDYVEKISHILNLTSEDLVVEVASNDGYLLQYFLQKSLTVLGIEPSSGVADIAKSKGVSTIVDFFGVEVAINLAKIKKAKLMIGNNVLAHVPNIHDFIAGFAIMIEDDGLITFEFPHLLSLIRNTQFDTIYHEHYSYLSILALQPIFENYELRIVDVEKISTHGGSLRIYVAKIASKWITQVSVKSIIEEEINFDPRNDYIIRSLSEKVQEIRLDLLHELSECKRVGMKISAYGAAAKGNTLLNFCGIDSEVIDYVVDLNPHKKGKYLPGSRIKIVGIEELKLNPPKILLILPWNLSEEIKNQLQFLRKHNVKFLKAIPRLEYF